MKAYCVLIRDPLVEGEFRGDSELCKVFNSRKKAKDFIEENELNEQVCPKTWHDARCELYIEEMEIE